MSSRISIGFVIAVLAEIVIAYRIYENRIFVSRCVVRLMLKFEARDMAFSPPLACDLDRHVHLPLTPYDTAMIDSICSSDRFHLQI